MAPPPPILPPWAKVLWYLAESVAIGATYKAYDYGQAITPAGGGEGAPEPTEWRRIQVRVSDTISAAVADDQVYTLDFVNYTNGSPDSSWTDPDHTQLANIVGNFIAAVALNTITRMVATEMRFYRMAFNPYSNPKPFAESGPPVHIHALSNAGANATEQIPQATSTITEETPSRRHWGRLYIPTIHGGTLKAGGRFTTATVDALCQAYSDMAVSASASDFFPVVPTTSQWNGQVSVPMRALQNVTGCRVDDVPDVIRRRRHRESSYMKRLPLPGP